MSWIAVAIAGSAIVGGIASSNAADTQAGAANNATAMQKAMFDQTQKNLAPYMTSGGLANSRLSDMLGTSGNTGAKGYGDLTRSFTPADYLANKDPGYQFQLQQGQQALQNSQAASDGVLSGAALKGLLGYNQGMAATGYQSAFDRWMSQNNSIYGRLSGVQSLGENAAAGLGNTGAQVGGSMAQSMIGAGNASAAGQVGMANALSGGVSQGLGYYYLNNMMNPGYQQGTISTGAPLAGTGGEF